MNDEEAAALLDAAGDLVYVCGPDGIVVDANEAGRGVVTDGVEGKPVWQLAGDSRRFERAVRDALERGESTVVTATVTDVGADFEFRLSPTDADGQTLFCVGRSLDVRSVAPGTRTDFEGHLDRVTDGFHFLDEDWRITYINDPARRVLNEAAGVSFDTDDWVGRNLWEMLPDVRDTPFYERYHEAVETREPVTIEEYYDPLEKWFEVRAFPSDDGLSVYFRDVTEQREHREELAERERVLREIHDVVSDPDRSFDEQVRALLSLGREVIGTRYGTLSQVSDDEYVFESVVAPDDAVSEGDVLSLGATNCERTVDTGETLVIENIAEQAPELAARAGNRKLVSCYLGAPVEIEGEPYGTFCFFDPDPRSEPFSEWEVAVVDLLSRWVGYELERQRTTDRLRQQNDQLEQIIQALSHDVRNPLNVALAHVELLEAENEHTETAIRSLKRIETLVEDLLSMAEQRAAAADPTTVQLATVARTAWSGVPTGDATLRVETDLNVEADESRLRRAFENLFLNAVEHGSNGTDRNLTVTVGASADGFFVADDGVGFGDVDPEDVFEAGYTTDSEGTGFGLAIVEEAAKTHGWTVTATESEMSGARFEFSDVPGRSPTDE